VSDPRLAPFRLPALAFAVFLVVQAASAAALFVAKLGPGPARIAEFYLGSEERFTAPRSLAGLLEVAVPHLVAIPLVLFAVAHVVGFARAVRPRAFRLLVAVSFASALLGVGAGFAVRWVAPSFAWAKLLAFAGLEVALLAWAALLALVFLPSHAVSLAPPARAAEEVAS
jgi:hypothetical protein